MPSNTLPKSTFNNLPVEKRDGILREAVREFAENGYQQASLNTIVRNLGIAKGSLYQYFDNKEALFLHIFEQLVFLIKQTVKEAGGQGKGDFYSQVQSVFLAGIRFIDTNPLYFQIYLKVLFERDVPRREELINRVRLFSADYFGPLCDQCKKEGLIRSDIPTVMIIFMLDALLDRFLQAYAQTYLDPGLGLAGKKPTGLKSSVACMIRILRDGLTPGAKQD